AAGPSAAGAPSPGSGSVEAHVLRLGRRFAARGRLCGHHPGRGQPPPAAAAIGRPGPGWAGIQLRHSTWTDRLGTPITSPGSTTVTSWGEISGTAVSRTFDHSTP